jgi:hypothetical protein
MGFFAESNLNVREATPTAGGLYFQPGNYTVEIQRVKMVKSQTNGKDFFAVETRVIESDNEKLGPESKPSWLVELPGQYPETAMGNVKDFLLAGYTYLAQQAGEDAPGVQDIGDEEADAVIGEDNLFAGAILQVTAFNKVTRKGNDFTRVRWAAAGAQ